MWQDNWIPGLRSLKPLIRLPNANVEKVCELFVPGTRVWDTEVVRNSFLALEGAKVMKITPSTRVDSDVLAWVFEKNGLYSARLAYKLLKGD